MKVNSNQVLLLLLRFVSTWPKNKEKPCAFCIASSLYPACYIATDIIILCSNTAWQDQKIQGKTVRGVVEVH